MNPAEWLRRTARRHPDAPALYRGASLEASYAEFARRAAGLGAALAAQGIGPGDRVALFMANRTEYLEALYGIWWAGAAAVPINAKLHAREAAWIVGDAGARLVFTDPKSEAALRPILADPLETVAADGPGFVALRDTAPARAPREMHGTDMAWLFYTSGTTGKPKGVMI